MMKKPANDMARSHMLLLLSLRDQGGPGELYPAKNDGRGGLGDGGGGGLSGMYIWKK